VVPYRLLDDAPTADVGFVATGETLAACFRAAADATLEVMLANPATLRAGERRRLHVESDAVDLALLKLLEELIYYKDAERLLLRVTDVDAKQHDGEWVVEATAEGEPIDPSRHQLSGDVKAVTLHRLQVLQTARGWEATVVLDV
jgi:SHS2 domain-containing protein